MTVRVGVIGVGMIGEDHIRRLKKVLAGAQVVGLTDVDPARAQAAAGGVTGVRVHASGQDLIGAEDVDAVVATPSRDTNGEPARSVRRLHLLGECGHGTSVDVLPA